MGSRYFVYCIHNVFRHRNEGIRLKFVPLIEDWEIIGSSYVFRLEGRITCFLIGKYNAMPNRIPFGAKSIEKCSII